MRTFLYTSLALFAFAGNSVLCRLALSENSIDASSFTIVRMVSGVACLAIILKATQFTQTTQTNRALTTSGSWYAALMLFVYALTISFAYISLETGVGALILFGAVQITMILAGLSQGNKLSKLEWLGLIVAFFGLVYLLLPGLGAPSLLGFVLMIVSGTAWGFYSLSGQGSKKPLNDTAYNFFRTLPLVAVLLAVAFPYIELSQQGVVLAVLSGGITSALGYTVWYMAMEGLSTTQAAVVQLLVPVIAAIGGVLFAQELFSLRLLVSTLLVLGGILLVLLSRYYSVETT